MSSDAGIAPVAVVGAGVAGLACALELLERGAQVEVLERARDLAQSCSWCAAAMLAPWCEAANAPSLLAKWGAESIDWWARRYPGTVRRGTLVVAAGRDAVELAAFAQRTSGWARLGREDIGRLEPDLAGRFEAGLWFEDEAHLHPRDALQALASRIIELGGAIRFGARLASDPAQERLIVDCRGLAARDALPDLRGVRGEMLIVRTRELGLSRPVRLLHPRTSAYIVPRGHDAFAIGATVIESDASGAVSVRSAAELLGAAYALHPAFADAEILECVAHVRPAFADNLPALRRRGATLYVNGFYRHGFLLAPLFAQRAAHELLNATRENLHDDHCEWDGAQSDGGDVGGCAQGAGLSRRDRGDGSQ